MTFFERILSIPSSFFGYFERKLGKISYFFLSFTLLLLFFGDLFSSIIVSPILDLYGFDGSYSLTRNITRLFASFCFIISLSALTFKYLKGSFEENVLYKSLIPRSDNVNISEDSKLIAEDNEKSQNLSANNIVDNFFEYYKRTSLSGAENKKLLISKILNDGSIEKYVDIFKWADDKIESLEDKSRIGSFIYAQGVEARTRLNREIKDLGRRGNINLIFGIIISVLGIGFLGWSVVNAPNIQVASIDFWGYFLTRSSFVLMIEIVAFFFLNLYRTSLYEIKYFQNEITNLDFKIIGIMACSSDRTNKSLIDIGKELMKVERNSVLKKGETTIEIEKERLSPAPFEKMFDRVISIIDRTDRKG